jgi:death-on-curing protein
LARLLNRVGYSDPDVAEPAAIYAIGIARNHPFVDRNKRTAFATLFMFLALNGMDFEPPEVDATMAVLRLAAGELTDDEFIAWVRASTQSPPP